jgi:hypothetical protein
LLNLGSEIRDQGWTKISIRDGKKSGSGIQDKHPGSATLDEGVQYELYTAALTTFSLLMFSFPFGVFLMSSCWLPGLVVPLHLGLTQYYKYLRQRGIIESLVSTVYSKY